MRYRSTVTGEYKEIDDTPSGSGSEDRERIAIGYNTVPERIRTEKLGEVDVFDEWVARDIEDIDLAQFVQTIQAIFPEMLLEDVVKEWLSAREPKITDALLYYVQLQVDALGIDIDIERFLRYELDDYRRTVLSRAASFKSRAITKLTQKASLSGSVPHTPFRSTMKSFTVKIPEYVPLSVVFDAYTPFTGIPVAVYSGMVKKLATYSSPVAPSDDDRIVFSRIVPSNYTASNIVVSNSETHLIVEYYVMQEEEEDEVLVSVSYLLGGLVDTISSPAPEYTGVQGVVYFIGRVFERYTFSDFVMNTPTASSSFILGEFTIHNGPIRIHDKVSGVVGVISVKHVGEYSTDNKFLAREAVSGTPYTRLFVVKARAIRDAEIFVKRVSGLFSLYSEEYKKIQKIYRSYISGFPEVNLNPGFTVPPPFERDPTIFVANYSRFCPHLPTPVTSDFHGAAEGSIEFPKGSGQRYICTDPEYRYPGVRENKLSNSEEYPYVPCCFKTDQRAKPKFRAYYSGDAEHRVQIRMITTTKPLNPGFFGILPKELTDIFHSIDANYTYLRHGVVHGPGSFLTCLNACTNKNVSRSRLAVLANAALCSQENPGKQVEDIVVAVEDEETYLSPRLYVRLLEEVFKVNIYVFDITGPVKYPTVQGRYMFKRAKRPVVIIYEHADIQQCELVVAWDSDTDNYKDIHPPEMTEWMDVLEREVHATWIGGRRLTPIPVPEFVPRCTAQYIDGHGKTRGLVIDEVYVACDPLPPLNVPTTSRPTEQYDSGILKEKYIKYFSGKGFVKLVPYSPSNMFIEAELEIARTAEYLCEVFMYMYSVWARGKDKQAGFGSSKSIAAFIADTVRAVPGKVYYRPGPETNKISRVMDGPGFAAESREMVQKLVYVLRLAIERNPSRVKAYHKSKYFDNYYQTLGDFRKGNFTIVPLESTQTHTPDMEYEEPLVQIDPQSSVFIIDIEGQLWNATRFMPADNDLEALARDSTVYVYNSPEDIFKIGDRESRTGEAVLVYKKDGVVYAFALNKYQIF
jgi:hypothetical protein